MNALLSIVLNSQHMIDIGDMLTQFREYTLHMTPENRGDAIG
jgi:hypothetical protein